MKPLPRLKISLTTRELFAFMLSLVYWKTAHKANHVIHNFETKFSQRYGYPSGVAVCKARIGFFLILQALRLKRGGEVIISGLHIADFVNIIRLAGFTPVVVDLKADSLAVDINDLEKKITNNTQLVLVTHLCGYTTDMDEILRLTEPRGIFVVEDCSQAVTSTLGDRMLGTYGVATIFSLGLLKPICTINGGFILSSDHTLIETIRREIQSWPPPSRTMLLLGIAKNLIIKLATNSVVFALFTRNILKLRTVIVDPFSKFQKQNRTVTLRSTIPQSFRKRFRWQQAVLGLSQLDTLKQREGNKAQTGKLLYSKIRLTSDVWLPKMRFPSGNSFWLFPIFTADVSRLQRHLLSCGVDSSQLLLSCLAEEPVFSELNFTTPYATAHKNNLLFLPMYSTISVEDVATISNALNNYP